MSAIITPTSTTTPAQEPPRLEQVLPRVWRWAAAGPGLPPSDRCGTALATADGVVLVDPAPLTDATRRQLEAEAGAVRHVLLTSGRHAALAAPFRGNGVTVWAPAVDHAGAPAGAGAAAQEKAAGSEPATPGAPVVDRWFTYQDRLPGETIVCALPAGAAGDGEVALLWPEAGGGLLLTGDLLPVVGQTPVYREGEAPPVQDYLDAVKSLLAVEPGAWAPAHQAEPDQGVAYSTAYAASIGSEYHRRRAAPVDGPRLLVVQPVRALQETLVAPVVVRRAPAGTGAPEDGWVADAFACARCGKPHRPMRQTCGGPPIARLCPECRALRRGALPVARLMVCAGGCCTREGARAVASAARQAAAAQGLAEVLDVVPVSCLGECSIGPFVRLSAARGAELPEAEQYRQQTVVRARRYAADEGEVIDDESELVLSRFAALVQPAETANLVTRVAETLRDGGPGRASSSAEGEEDRHAAAAVQQDDLPL